MSQQRHSRSRPRPEPTTVSPEKGKGKKKNELFEWMSALQKDIRRGKEREALYWAIRLSEINSTLVWNRLEIIASEDIGPANPNMTLIVSNLRARYEKALNNDKDSYRLFLAHAIIELSRSEKSRVVDDLIWDVFWEIEHNQMELTVPDYAKDHHVRGGDKRKWTEEGSKLVNESSLSNPYKEKATKNLLSNKKLTKHYPKNHPSNRKPKHVYSIKKTVNTGRKSK